MTEISISQVKDLIYQLLPNKNLTRVIDHGIWARHIFELVFDDGTKAFMKVQVHQEWLDSTVNEVRLSALLRSHGLPGPETILIDAEGKYLGSPMLIQASLGGVRWSQWLAETNQDDWPMLFKAVGQSYAGIHRIKGTSSGVWDGGPEKTLPISPNDYYFNSEILEGSGQSALDSGIITRTEYLKIQSIWEAALPALKDHVPSLVHGSPFPWSICLMSDDRDGFKVTRLNALGDFLWWDPAYDLALLQYPPGYAWPRECWDAFCEAYGLLPEDWRRNTYAILQHLCALNDVYLAPTTQRGPKISKAESIRRLKQLLTLF